MTTEKREVELPKLGAFIIPGSKDMEYSVIAFPLLGKLTRAQALEIIRRVEGWGKMVDALERWISWANRFEAETGCNLPTVYYESQEALAGVKP